MWDYAFLCLNEGNGAQVSGSGQSQKLPEPSECME